MPAPKRFKPNPPETDDASEETSSRASGSPKPLDQENQVNEGQSCLPHKESRSRVGRPGPRRQLGNLHDHCRSPNGTDADGPALPRLEDALMEEEGSISPEWEDEGNDEAVTALLSQDSSAAAQYLCRAPRKRKRNMRLSRATPAAAQSTPSETVPAPASATESVGVLPETSSPPSTSSSHHQVPEDLPEDYPTPPESASETLPPSTAQPSDIFPSEDEDGEHS